MKSSHLFLALALGVLLGVLVFALARQKTPGKPVPTQDAEERVTPSPPEKGASQASHSNPPPVPQPDSGLVAIPGGIFRAGPEGAPVNVGAFRIDRTEVTNGQYEAFLNNCPPGSNCGPRDRPSYWEDQAYLEMRRNHPVVFVSWEDASSFCRWEGGRLPTVFEWEKAARGDDGRNFPSGDSVDSARVNILGDRHEEKNRAPRQIPTWGTQDERYARDQSPYGVLGMTGNVSEWTASPSEEEPDLRVAAGGSWDSWDLNDGRVYNRLPKSPADRSSSLGFRCAFSPKVIHGDVLRMAAEPDTPPMLIREGNSYSGFDWEIASVIARRLGLSRVEVVPGKYSELPGRLISGKADVIVSGYTADPSIAGVDWSESYFDYGLCLIVRNGSPIHSIDDLRGKVIGIFNDPAAESDVKSLVKGYRRLEKYEDGYFDLLADGKLDAFLYDFPYTQEEIKPYGDKLKIVQYNLTESTYNVGVRHGATELLKEVNAAIRGLKESDKYRQIIRRYLGGSGPAPVTSIAADQEIYRVQPGDTLSQIARSRLGNLSRWSEIWDLNKGRIANPNLIEIGWELVIPTH